MAGQSSRKRSVLFVGAKAHHAFDPGAVVPTAVENDDFAGGGKVCDVALHVHHGFLAVRRRGQGDDAEDARADPLGDGADGAPLAGGVAAFRTGRSRGVLLFYPILEMAKFFLEFL